VEIVKMNEEKLKGAKSHIYLARDMIDRVKKELREARGLNDIDLIKWKIEEAEETLRAVDQRLGLAIDLLLEARIY